MDYVANFVTRPWVNIGVLSLRSWYIAICDRPYLNSVKPTIIFSNNVNMSRLIITKKITSQSVDSREFSVFCTLLKVTLFSETKSQTCFFVSCSK